MLHSFVLLLFLSSFSFSASYVFSLLSYSFSLSEILFLAPFGICTHVCLCAFFSFLHLVTLIVSLNICMPSKLIHKGQSAPEGNGIQKGQKAKYSLCCAMGFECDSKTIVTNNNVKQSNKYPANKRSALSGSFV